ncbi:hypothetical protein [Oenococcus sicerae]|uniref:hypothetical protein n=1 Tax=Oenococcus sicerae TaxID=2203724 RepID=UPI0010BBD5C9|nr:hypothetical protein OAL24_00082 [Oenococcus sicerae]
MTKTAGFSNFEKEAMRQRAAELRKEQSNKGSKKNGEADVLEKISEMSDQEAVIATNLHQLVKTIAPNLSAKTWYSMPAYANENGQVVIFFQAASKFKTRYATIGFSDLAHLDENDLWPTSYAITEWNSSVSKTLTKLIQRAVA